MRAAAAQGAPEVPPTRPRYPQNRTNSPKPAVIMSGPKCSLRSHLSLHLAHADSGPDGHDETVNDGMSWSFRAATLARVSFHKVETA